MSSLRSFLSRPLLIILILFLLCLIIRRWATQFDEDRLYSRPDSEDDTCSLYDWGRRLSSYEDDCSKVSLSRDGGFNSSPHFLSMFDWRTKHTLEDFVTGKCDKNDFKSAYNSFQISMLVFFCICPFFILFGCTGNCCSRILVWKISYRVYSEDEKSLCVNIFLGLLLILIGISLTGLVYMCYYDKGLKQARCMASKTSETILNGGDDSTTWIGFTAIKQDIEKLIQDIIDYEPLFYEAESDFEVSGMSQLSELAFNLSAGIEAFYWNNYNLSVRNPDPEKVLNVSTSYIDNLKSNTEALWNQSDQYLFKVTDPLRVVYDNIEYILNENNQIEEIASQKIRILDDFQSDLEQIKENVDTYVLDIHGKALTSLLYGLFFYFVVFIIGWVITAVGLVLYIITNKKMYRKSHHLAWFCPCFNVMFGIGLVAYLAPMGLTIYDTCNFLEEATTTTGLFTYSEYLSKNSANLLNICLNSKTQIHKNIDIAEEGNLEEITFEGTFTFGDYLYSSFEDISDNYSISMNNFTDLSSQLAEVFSSYYDPNTAYPNSNQTLIEFNTWTDLYCPNTKVISCDYLNYIMVMNDSRNCKAIPYLYDPQYVSKDAECVDISDWSYAKFIYTFSSRKIDCEYNINYTSEQIQNSIYLYAQSLVNYVNDVKHLYSSLKSQLSNIEDQIHNMVTILYTGLEGYYEFKNDTYEFVNLIANNQTGLVSSMNCSFMRENYDYFKVGLCNYLYPSIDVVSFCLFLLIVMGIFASLIGCFIFIRHKYETFDEYQSLILNSSF